MYAKIIYANFHVQCITLLHQCVEIWKDSLQLFEGKDGVSRGVGRYGWEKSEDTYSLSALHGLEIANIFVPSSFLHW